MLWGRMRGAGTGAGDGELQLGMLDAGLRGASGGTFPSCCRGSADSKVAVRSSPWGFPALSRVIAKLRYSACEKSLLLVPLHGVGGGAASSDCAVLSTVKRPCQLGNDFMVCKEFL